MLACIDSKIQLNTKTLEQKPLECEESFDRRYFKRSHAIKVGIAVVAFLIGAGVLKWTDLLKIF
jgi:hypothetical protein